MAGSITADALLEALNDGNDVQMVDVREPDEFADWSIPGAVNLPLGSLEGHLGDLDSSRPVVAVCLGGSRAERAAALIEAGGFAVEVLAGGMGAWSTVADEVEATFGPFRLVQVRRRGKGCLSYVVAAGGSAMVVDASLDTDRYLAIAARLGTKIVAVTDTHLHADHVSGGRRLAAASGAALLLNADDAFEYEYQPLQGIDGIELGDGHRVEVTVVPTPGHTTGSTVFSLDGLAMLTGDTMFLDSVGRPDLADRAEEFARALYHSLRERVLAFSDDALVLPGHFSPRTEVVAGELVAATLGELRQTLQPLTMAEEEFVAWAVAQATPRPPSYVAIVDANRFEQTLNLGELAALEVGPNRCAIS